MDDINSNSKPKRRKNGAGTIWFDVKANRWRARYPVHTRYGLKYKTISRGSENAVKMALGKVLRRVAKENFDIEDRKGSKVYFIQSEMGGPIKIGTTKNIDERLQKLQLCCPVPLIVLFTINDAGHDLEAKLHRRFRLHRLHGEWFDNTPELLRYMELLKKDTRAAYLEIVAN